MSIFKKAAAFLTAAGIAASCASCGYNTLTALTVDGMEVPAGVYIYYANNSYNQALSKLKEENEELDTTDTAAVKALTLEGKDITTWVQDEATKQCTEFVVIEKKFDELGLSLDAVTKSNISMMKDYYWQSSQKMMEKNGISEASFEKVVTSSYKSNEIFKYYYAIGGEQGVTDEDVYNYYKDNNIRAEYLTISLKDGEGNLLKSDGKAEMMKMAEGYRDRVEDALAEGGIKAVKEEMTKIREDYEAYRESLTADESDEETVGETTEPLTTEEATEAETIEETVGETTEAETTEETVEETTEAETETIEVTNAALNEPQSTEAETAAEDADETDAEDEDTTEPSEENPSEDFDEETTEEETAEKDTSDEDEDTDSDEDEDTDSDEDEDADSDEDGAVFEETADEDDENPYQNESIISVIHEEDYDDPDAIYYTPSENAYKQLLSIGAKDYGKPYIVEDDEYYYLVVRYDIEDRMVANDLWTDDTKESTIYDMYDKDFTDMVDGWTSAANVQRNAAAYKRYDPFKFDFT